MKYLSAGALGALIGAMLIFPLQAADAARQGLLLWARAVAPVLGPFLALMLLLSSRLPGGAGGKILLSWLCGSPGGARLMQAMHPRGRTALRYAAMTGTMSPMFFLATVSGWLESPAAGWKILLCHLGGALLAGLCFRCGERAPAASPAPMPLPQALRESALALLNVALCMALGCVCARMAACALPRLPMWAVVGVQCLLEVTGGVQALSALRPPLACSLICAACSLGGLSLLMQNGAVWRESGLGLPALLGCRGLHALFAFLLCLLAGG